MKAEVPVSWLQVPVCPVPVNHLQNATRSKADLSACDTSRCLVLSVLLLGGTAAPSKGAFWGLWVTDSGGRLSRLFDASCMAKTETVGES